MLNQETRTISMDRADMCRIRIALTSVMLSFDEGTNSREMWARIRQDFINQIEAQDQASVNVDA